LNPRPKPAFSKVALYDSITSSSKSGADEREYNCSNPTPLRSSQGCTVFGGDGNRRN
jgi:hypothetical protein